MKRFSSKVLVFGEYGLLYGAKALAIPFTNFFGELQFSDQSLIPKTKEFESRLEITQLISYFTHEDYNEKMNFPLELDRLRDDLEKGLFFNSNIPLQYGVGSSGALCAALFDQYSCYHQGKKDSRQRVDLLKALKHDFSIMESYFHGSSSGFDPLVSFLDKPVILENNSVKLIKLHSNFTACSIFLVDTGTVGPTSPLVALFREKMNEKSFAESFRNEYIPLNNQLVDAFVNGDDSQLFKLLSEFTQLQKNYFAEMIPSGFHSIIEECGKQGIYLKLLGSGGGGFLLGFSSRLPEAINGSRVLSLFS